VTKPNFIFLAKPILSIGKNGRVRKKRKKEKIEGRMKILELYSHPRIPYLSISRYKGTTMNQKEKRYLFVILILT